MALTDPTAHTSGPDTTHPGEDVATYDGESSALNDQGARLVVVHRPDGSASFRITTTSSRGVERRGPGLILSAAEMARFDSRREQLGHHLRAQSGR